VKELAEVDEFAGRWINSIMKEVTQRAYLSAWKLYTLNTGLSGKDLIEEAWKDTQKTPFEKTHAVKQRLSKFFNYLTNEKYNHTTKRKGLSPKTTAAYVAAIRSFYTFYGAIFLTGVLVGTFLFFIGHSYDRQVKTISDYIKDIEDGKKLPSLEEMFSKRKESKLKKIFVYLRQNWEKIKEFIKPYVIIIFVYFTFYLICNAVYKAEVSNPKLLPALSETKESLLWGFFTFMFIHESYSHLSNNMQSIIQSTTLFLALLLFSNYRNPKKVAFIYCIIPFTSSMLTGILFIFSNPNFRGASGVVYATEGVILSTASYNIYLIIRWAFSYKGMFPLLKKKLVHLTIKERIKNGTILFKNIFSPIFNVIIFGFYLYVISSYSTFFNISSNVVWIVHVFCFFIGLLFSLLFLLKIEPFTNRNALLFPNKT